VVVDPTNSNACLDPNAAFSVSAGGNLLGQPCHPVRLPLFANRNGYPIDFVWTLTMKPSESTASVLANPSGTVSLSRHWEYAYPSGGGAGVPTFIPDVPGTYHLQLTARLPAVDPIYPGVQQATSAFDVVVQ
jgi:hypothetical protein